MVRMTHNNLKLTAKIALYQPDIPQNTASIIRTCSCLGIKLEIIEPCGFTFQDKRFRRVMMDYLDEKMIKIYENSDQFFKAKKDTRIILMTTKAKDSFKSFRMKKNDTFLFGRESAGVPESIHYKVDKRLTIPMLKKKRSLNLSTTVSMVAAKIILQPN